MFFSAVDQKKQVIGKNYFIGSILLHLLGVTSFFFLPQSIRQFLLGDRDQKLIREFVQVDLVGMPKLTVKELKQMAPDVDFQKTPTKDPILENSKDQVPSNIEKKSRPENKESLQSFFNSMASKKLPKYNQPKANNSSRSIGVKTSAKRLGKLERLALEGNELSRGSVSVGENTGFSDDDYQIYLSSIPSQVRPYWSLPSYLSDKNLRARVKIRLDGRGRIIDLKLVESSGVDEFDRRALQSIKSVKLFTTPSKSIRELLAIKGVILGFPL